jgi:hypothetical protein
VKRFNSFAEAASARSEQSQGGGHGVHSSPYLTTAQLSDYLQFTSLKACRRWLDENPGLPFVRRGKRTKLYDRRTVDLYIADELPRLRAVRRKPSANQLVSRRVNRSVHVASVGHSSPTV